MMQGGNLQTCTTCSLSTHTHTHERARLRVCVHYNGDGLLYPGKVMTYNPMRV
nr:MAG TPA: zinc finger protein [Caudoviricetes sp.]